VRCGLADSFAETQYTQYGRVGCWVLGVELLVAGCWLLGATKVVEMCALAPAAPTPQVRAARRRDSPAGRPWHRTRPASLHLRRPSSSPPMSVATSVTVNEPEAPTPAHRQTAANVPPSMASCPAMSLLTLIPNHCCKSVHAALYSAMARIAPLRPPL